MKLLHVASGRLFGGVEQMLLTMARAGSVAGLRHGFAVAAGGRLHDELHAAGADIHLLGDVRLRRPASVMAARVRFRRLLATNPPDVVICHAPWACALFAPAAKRRGLPVVWWQHDAADGRPLVERWARRTRADLVIANSRWTARSAPVVQPGSPVEVVHCPVAFEDRRAGRDEVRGSLGVGPSDVVVLIASRMERWKGHAALLEAAAAMTDLPGWVVWVAGAPQKRGEARYHRELHRLSGRLGVSPRIRFIGERRDMPSILAAADVLCQPNHRPEPFGLIFAEAMLAGLPVVTTGFGGATEIVGDEAGRLVPPGDPGALAGALRELVVRADLRQALGAAGRRLARERCAPEAALARLGSVLERMTTRAAA